MSRDKFVASAFHRKCKSKSYKYVSMYCNGYGVVKWVMAVRIEIGHKVTTTSKFYDTEIQAAKAVDLFFIRHGKKPVNGLIKPITR